MSQRQSLPFKKPEIKDATLPMVSYMLDQCEVPIIFMDMEEWYLSQTGRENLNLLESYTNVEYITVVSEFIQLSMDTATAMVINDTLCIIGKSSYYYVIDLYNGLLFATEAPEYEFTANMIVSAKIYGNLLPPPPLKKVKKGQK